MILTVIGGEYMIEKDILPEKQSMYFVMLSLVFGAMIALIYTNDLFYRICFYRNKHNMLLRSYNE